MGGKTQTPTAAAENHSVCWRGPALLIGVGDGKGSCGPVLLEGRREANWSGGLQKAGRRQRDAGASMSESNATPTREVQPQAILLGRADNGWDGTAKGLLVFRDVDGIAGEFFGKVFQEFLRESILFFAAGGERQEDLGEGLQVVAAINGLLHLLHTEAFVAVNAAEPKHEARRPGQRADDVVGTAERDIGVVGVRALPE